MVTNLKNLTIVNPNYIACLMWKDQYGRTYRYALWSGVGESTPLGFPLYSGQLIKKNFRIEIWSINGQNVTETVGDSVITSVLQGIDYRYGNDGPLGSNDGEVTQFACQAVAGTVGFPITNGLQAHWIGNTITNAGWASSEGYAYTIPVTSPITVNSIAVNPVADVNGIYTGIFVGKPVIFPAQIFSLVYFSGTTGALYSIGGVQYALVNPNDATTITVSLEDGNSCNIPFGEWVIVEVGYTAGSSYIRYFTLTGQAPYSQPSLTGSTTNVQNTSVFSLQGNPFYYAEILVFNQYQGIPIGQSVLNYLYSRYNFNYNLPMVFPANSSPQPNTI